MKKLKTAKCKNLLETVTYAYIRKIKKWMFCPNCQQGKMTINKKSTLWICEDCGYKLLADEFEDDYVFWFCDECNAYLNNQEGFDRKLPRHICKKCGYENDTTFDNVKGICSDCGKIIPDLDVTLCINCKQERKKKAKEWLKTAGKIVSVAAVVAGTVYLTSQSTDGDESTDYKYLPAGDDDSEDGGSGVEKAFICRGCGYTWTMIEDEDGFFNGYGVPPCPICGDSGCDPNDYADYTCEYCGHQWRQYGNGGLVLGCIPRCPKCRS